MRKGQTAPRTMTGGLRAKAWWVLRKNRYMTLAELMLTICNGDEKSAESNLRRWLNNLVSAGLLTRERIDDGKLTSNGSYRYTLVKDLGPKAPVIRISTGNVYDPNSGKITLYKGLLP
jgi:hypothetical protein